MVRSYYALFKTFGGGSFHSIQARSDSEHDAIVMTDVLPFKGKPVNFEWRINERNDNTTVASLPR